MAIAIVDTTIAVSTTSAVTIASHTIAAGNGAALMCAANGLNGTNHTFSITGSHTFTSRVTISDTAGQPGCAAGFSINNSPGATGTTTVTENSGNNDGVSAAVSELSGCETTFSGATASGSSASGTPSVAITVVNANSFVFGASSDWATSGAYTAGPGETLDQSHHIVGNYSGGQWHSTTTQGAGSYTSDAAGSATRQYNIVAMEMSPSAAATKAPPPRRQPNRFVNRRRAA